MDVINLKSEKSLGENPEFKINHLGAGRREILDGDNLSESELSEYQVSGKVKISFEKFVNLIANHDYEEIFSKKIDTDVIISTDLLADLANSHQSGAEGGKKISYFFIGGIVLGIIVTWILLKT